MAALATLFELDQPAKDHPAKYTDSLLPTMVRFLQARRRILDPFGGTGKVFLLEHWLPDATFEAVEIEPEWASMHPRMTVGNALHLPWGDDYFDAINTSPTYANRMADQHFQSKRPGDVRLTYSFLLERPLHPDNSGRLQWGEKYREFHRQAWLEARRVLVEGGSFVLNIKDHIRDKKLAPVTDWHIECLSALGFRVVGHVEIATKSMRKGQNYQARVPFESVIHFILEDKS